MRLRATLASANCLLAVVLIRLRIAWDSLNVCLAVSTFKRLLSITELEIAPSENNFS